MELPRKQLLHCLQIMLGPITRFCLRRSISAQEVIDITKRLLVNAASQEIAATGETVTVSRLSAITGLNRRDVMRMQAKADNTEERPGVVTRVVGQWLGDKRFHDSKGNPRTLTYIATDSEFRTLVAAVSKDLNAMPVLSELERVGTVVKEGDKVRLVRPTYITRRDPTGTLLLLGRDTADLMTAVEENAFAEGEPPHLHATTHYDKVTPTAISQIRRWFMQEAVELHARSRAFLAQFDADLNPDLPQSGEFARVAIGTFGLLEQKSQKTNQPDQPKQVQKESKKQKGRTK